MSFFDDLVGISVVHIPSDPQAVACVEACDNDVRGEDEDWWNSCIDTCIRNGGPLADLATEIVKGINEHD